MRFAAWLERVIVVAAALAVVGCIGLVVTFSYGRDQGIYAMVARAILEGEMPYRDAFDFKPPGIFVIYAVARGLFGSAQVGVRLLEAAGLAGMALGMVHLARVEWGDGRIGLVAAAMAVAVHAQLDFWHTAQPESFGGMLTILGIALARRGHLAAGARERWVMWTLTGVVFGIAGCMKPPLAGQAAVLALLSAALPARPDLARRVTPVVAAGAGGALAIGVFVAWFAAKGALAAAHEVLFVYTPHYTAIGWEGQRVLPLVAYGVRDWFSGYSMVLPVGLGLLVAFRPRGAEWRLGVVTAALIVVQLAGVVLQAKFFPYHYGALWPITALLSAFGWFRLLSWCRDRFAWTMLLPVALFVALAWYRSATRQVYGSFVERSALRAGMWIRGDFDPALSDWLATVADVDAAHNRAVAAVVAERTPAGAPIFVWGFEPVIYDLADRSPATRYLYNVPQRTEWSRAEAQAQLMEDLRARPPAAIVVEHGDVFPWVTGSLDDSAAALRSFAALSELIATRYAAVAVVDDFDVYVLEAGGAEAPTR